jgi:hypothetical protein
MMIPTFPLVAGRHAGKDDQPPTADAFAVFDARGYWARLDGILFQAPATMPGAQIMVEHVARMCNAAYERGKSDKLREVQDVLQIARGDDE